MTNAVEPQANASAAERPNKSEFWSLLLSSKAQVWAVAVALFYISGFLVLNAHLSKFGLSDTEFISGRYLLAAANFAFFLICFYLFAGRAIVFVQVWISQDLKSVNREKPSAFWSLVVVAHSLVSNTFFCCLSAAMYTGVALWQIETQYFYAALGGAFFISYTMDVTNLDIRFHRINEIIQMVVKLAAVYAFFVTPNNWNLIGVFAFYLGIMAYINIVMDTFQRRGVHPDRVAFSVVHSVIVLLSTALGFGATFFGSVSSKIGGGRQPEVAITLSDTAKASLPRYIAKNADDSFNGKLVHQTEKYTFISVSDHTLRFKSDDIALMAVTPEKSGDFSEALRKVFSASHSAPDKVPAKTAVPASKP
jgi:hypothetical protein